MDRNKMLQVLVPALAVAGVVLLIGVLIYLSNWDQDTGSAGKGKGGDAAAAAGPPPTGDASGMSLSLPPLDATEWKSGPGGMRVWDVKEGEGEPCKPGAEVTIHYTGWTKDGNVFDSSVKRGQPTTFPLGDLIRGWQEGIPGMKPGGIRRLEIPYAWAYGERGRPPSIPAKADLVFEVKLIAAK